jgi:hypothetical protein
MTDPFDPLSRDPLREELQHAATSPANSGDESGNWSDVVRGVRRRRARRIATRAVVPGVCVLLVAAGAIAFAARTNDDASTPANSSSPPTASLTSSPGNTALDTSTTQTTSAPTTSVVSRTTDVAVATTNPTTSSLIPVTSTTTSTLAPVAPDAGRTVPLNLNLATGFVSASDGVHAFVWSRADGQGLSLDPASLLTTPIAALPTEVLTSLCNTDVTAWTGAAVFLASTTSFALYDPRADTWTSGLLPSPRYCPLERLTVWAGSRILLLGGSTAPFGDPNYAPIQTAWLFDPESLQWSVSSPAPSNRSNDLSAVFVNGVIVLAGDGERLDQTPPFLEYRLATDDWIELAPPGPLTYTPYVTAYGNALLAIGLDNQASALTDPVTPNWVAFQPSAPPDGGRHPHAFAHNGPRLVYLYGSTSSRVSVFDGSEWYESQALDLPASWGDEAVTSVGDFLVVAGESTGSAATRTPEAFVVAIAALTPPVLGD